MSLIILAVLSDVNVKFCKKQKQINVFIIVCGSQGFCPLGHHNRMADILFKTGEGGLHAILHAPLGQSQSV